MSGHLSYQPFIFSDDLEVGVGYEFEEQHYAGIVYYPDMPEEYRSSPELKRRLVDPSLYPHFHAANRRLALYYDSLVDGIVSLLGHPAEYTVLDVGCNTGYIPLRFALSGARRAVGYDRENFSAVFDVLRQVTGVNIDYCQSYYDPRAHKINSTDTFHLVTCMAMLCHVSDPLHLLSELCRISTGAVFVWSLFNEDNTLSIRYGEPRGDYADDAFPYCFDNMVAPSVPLIVKSFEMCGFSHVHEIVPAPTVPGYRWKEYPFRGFLAIR